MLKMMEAKNTKTCDYFWKDSKIFWRSEKRKWLLEVTNPRRNRNLKSLTLNPKPEPEVLKRLYISPKPEAGVFELLTLNLFSGPKVARVAQNLRPKSCDIKIVAIKILCNTNLIKK